MDEYLTPKEVAIALKVCTRTVINMINDKRLKAIRTSGKQRITYRILAKELDRFIAEEYSEREINKPSS